MTEVAKAPIVFLIAGEPSGDALGGPLMRRLRELDPSLRFAGIGGREMAAEGLDSLFPMEELSVMGLAEVAPRLPNLLRRIRETANAIKVARPAVVVTIDSPDFTLRVAKRIRGLGIPVIHYVAPTVWAWRPGRAAKLARIVDHVMTLLPFEPPYFEAVGLDATFVGHPIAEAVPANGGRALRDTLAIKPSEAVLAMLPGSRRGEIDRLLAVFGETVAKLQSALGDRRLRILAPTLPHLSGHIRAATDPWPVTVDILEDRAQFYPALAAADAALCASGTVVLELARAGLPGVVAYKLNALTAWVARRLIRLRYVSLVNIVAGHSVMPEHLQENCEPGRLSADLQTLLSDEGARQRQIEAFKKVMTDLGEGGDPPSCRAAKVVKSLIPRR